jgi:hypothetical protein
VAGPLALTDAQMDSVTAGQVEINQSNISSVEVGPGNSVSAVTTTYVEASSMTQTNGSTVTVTQSNTVVVTVEDGGPI